MYIVGYVGSYQIGNIGINFSWCFLFLCYRKVGKRKAALKADKSSKKGTKKDQKAKKDPNKPKRPASAFFVFL